MRLLHQIIKEVSDKVNLPCVAIYAQGENGYNEKLDEAIGNHSRLLMFELAQRPRLFITGSLHGYLEYPATLMFLTASGSNDTDTDMRNKISQMVQMAYEWLTWLRRDPNWRKHYLNNADDLSVNITELVDVFDSEVVGVSLSLDIRIDPDFDKSNLCP